MKIKLESDGDPKDFDIPTEWQSLHSGKSILLKPNLISDANVEYHYDYSRYGRGAGGRPESSICFYGSAQIVDDLKDKVAEIVRLFDSVTDEGDVQFLKRYFEIKFALK